MRFTLTTLRSCGCQLVCQVSGTSLAGLSQSLYIGAPADIIPNETLHFIADLSELSFEKIELIKENLVIFGRSIYEKNGSFVIVSSHNFHEYLNIVPSLQEAYDFIQMEDIERQFNI